MANRTIQDALDLVIRNYREAKGRFQRQMQQRRGDQLAGRALAALKREPGQPNYLIRWTSEKQRRAFFASRGFGRGIPASRSNPPEVLAGWKAAFIATDDGGILALDNDVPHMKFVQGEYAQGFHQDTGYVQVDDVEQDFYREAEGAIVEGWFEAADPLRGI